jgi:hypothetical protein
MGDGTGQEATWTRWYEGLIGPGEVPMTGVRMIIGLDKEGRQKFYAVVDGHEDNMTACFMLDMAADAIRDQARGVYAGTRVNRHVA